MLRASNPLKRFSGLCWRVRRVPVSTRHPLEWSLTGAGKMISQIQPLDKEAAQTKWQDRAQRAWGRWLFSCLLPPVAWVSWFSRGNPESCSVERPRLGVTVEGVHWSLTLFLSVCLWVKYTPTVVTFLAKSTHGSLAPVRWWLKFHPLQSDSSCLRMISS